MKMNEKNLTEGGILKTMLLFSIPMILGNVLQQIYNIADTAVVGRFIGSEALAAVGSAYSLMTFITSIVIGLCMGSSAVFSIAYGAGDRAGLKESMWVSFWFILAVTLLLNGLVVIFNRQILHLLQIPKAVYPLMDRYVEIIYCGIFFVFIYNYFSCLLRALGNSLTPLIFLAVSSVLNIVLDILFVAGFHFGVEGAAAATVISQILAGVGIAIFSFRKMPELRVEKEYRHFKRSTIQRVISYSSITCAQQSVMNFGILMIQGLVNSFGAVIMAAFAVAVKIDTLAYMPAQEFGNAFSLFIAQNFGARKYDRIRKGVRQAFAVSIIFCLLVSAIVWIFSGQMIAAFLDHPDPEIIEAGKEYLHIEGAFYLGIGCLFLLYGLYRAVNKPAMSLILTVISLGTRVALSYLLAPNPAFGVTAIWWSIPIGWGFADIVGILYFIRHEKRIKT